MSRPLISEASVQSASETLKSGWLGYGPRCIEIESAFRAKRGGWALATQPFLRGNRVGVITNSGGPGTAMSHVCEGGGMEIPVLSEKLQEAIRPMMTPHAPRGNPDDITFSLDTAALTTEIPRLAMESGEIDGLVLHGAMGSGFVKAIYPHIKEFIQGMTIDEITGSLNTVSYTHLTFQTRYTL